MKRGGVTAWITLALVAGCVSDVGDTTSIADANDLCPVPGQDARYGCQLGRDDDPGKVVGCCCSPRNADGEVMENNGQPLQGVCDEGLCRFGLAEAQAGRAPECENGR